jgi:hypothetical protein
VSHQKVRRIVDGTDKLRTSGRQRRSGERGNATNRSIRQRRGTPKHRQQRPSGKDGEGRNLEDAPDMDVRQREYPLNGSARRQ